MGRGLICMDQNGVFYMIIQSILLKRSYFSKPRGEKQLQTKNHKAIRLSPTTLPPLFIVDCLCL